MDHFANNSMKSMLQSVMQRAESAGLAEQKISINAMNSPKSIQRDMVS
jgi:hypothetical protein